MLLYYHNSISQLLQTVSYTRGDNVLPPLLASPLLLQVWVSLSAGETIRNWSKQHRRNGELVPKQLLC